MNEHFLNVTLNSVNIQVSNIFFQIELQQNK